MNASAITAGTVATARLGSGTASSSTVLYGDQTYKAEPGGAWNLIKTETASSSSEITFIDGASSVVFDNTYNIYCIIVQNTVPVNNNVAFIATITNDSGSSYESTYSYSEDMVFSADGSTNTGYTSNSSAGIAYLRGNGNGAGKCGGMTMWIANPSTTGTFPSVWGTGLSYDDGSNVRAKYFGGMYATTGAYDGIKFAYSSGNIASGTFSLYGMTT
jgi:hypothetical protein